MTSSHPAIARAAVITGALALSVIALPGIAAADPGTIKVHAPGTALDSKANEPKQACAFRIAAFGASAGETYRVTFEPQGGDNVAGEPTTATATYTASENVSKNGKSADGRTRIFNADADNLEIVSGQYKVTAANVDDAGDKKTKVFRVECVAGPGGGTPTPTPTPGGGGGGGGDDGEDDGSVGGVGNPDDEDEDGGTPGVGGVGTGGGGLAGGGSDVPTVPLLLLTGGAVAAVLGAKRFRKSG